MFTGIPQPRLGLDAHCVPDVEDTFYRDFSLSEAPLLGESLMVL